VSTRKASPGGRVVSCILALVVGAVFGAVGTVAHQSTLTIGTVALPLGLPLALLGVFALLLGFRLLLRDRLVVLLAAVGVVAVIALFSVQSPGGSVLIPQGFAGIVWTIGPVLLATVVVAWPRLPERVAAPERTASEA
jgi:4-amino-4-deoxy-L-arabinose transferase-like glycosyltransferase